MSSVEPETARMQPRPTNGYMTEAALNPLWSQGVYNEASWRKSWCKAYQIFLYIYIYLFFVKAGLHADSKCLFYNNNNNKI